MRKRSPHSKTKITPNSLERYLQAYDAVTLSKVLSHFETSEGWAMFVAYASMVQRQYEIEALDLLGKEGATKSASFASGYAKGVEDVTQSFLQGLRNTVNNVSMIVEDPRPEEVV